MLLDLSIDELSDAFSILLDDAEHMRFVVHPYEIALVFVDIDRWLQDVHDRITSGAYTPQVPQIADIPKGKGGVRPGTLLSLGDQVVYAGLVGRCLAPIASTIPTPYDSIDFAHRMQRPIDYRRWLKNWFADWQDFMNASIAKARESEDTWLLETDIAGFYENVDLDRLESDLKSAGVADADAQNLREFLSIVSDEKDRGLPQGYQASDILGKLYLNSIDRELLERGWAHTRYSDDIRIFANSEVDAKRALLLLTQLLRAKSLIPQSAKTQIRPAADAIDDFEGFAPMIRDLDKQYRSKQLEVVDIQYHGHYSIRESMEEIRDLDAIPVDVLRTAFLENISLDSLDKTLLHYLLRRLGDEKDPVAISFCLAALGPYPQETEYVTKYLAKVDYSPADFDLLLDFLESPNAIYEYQLYVIMRWLRRTPHERLFNIERLLRIVRGYAFQRDHEPYLRSQTRAFLGRHGTPTDVERLLAEFPRAESDLERSEIIMSIRALETGRRERFLSAASGQGDLCARAANILRRPRR